MRVNKTPTLTANAALAPFLRVKISSSKLVAAGAEDVEIGTLAGRVLAADDAAAIVPRNVEGTIKMVASAAITQYANVYGAAGGKIDDVANNNAIGIALHAASGDNSIIEVLRLDLMEESSGDDVSQIFGTGGDAELLWSTGDDSNHSLVVALGNSSQALHITDLGAKATDWNVAADTDPTLYIHSNTTPATDYMKIGVHTGSAAWGADLVGAATLNFGFDGLEALVLKEVASAINEVAVSNAAAAGAPKVEAQGGDTNISLDLSAKGTGVIAARANFVHKTTQTALTDTATVTIAQLITKVLDGTPTGAAAYTLPTAALLVAGIANCAVGDSFEFAINNKSGGANTITVAAGSGGTADGTLTVAQNVVRTFKVIVTNVTNSSEAYFVYGIG